MFAKPGFNLFNSILLAGLLWLAPDRARAQSYMGLGTEDVQVTLDDSDLFEVEIWNHMVRFWSDGAPTTSLIPFGSGDITVTVQTDSSGSQIYVRDYSNAGFFGSDLELVFDCGSGSDDISHGYSPILPFDANLITDFDCTINGNGGNDVLEGGNGNDTINGGAGLDELSGQGGHDELSGGWHNDDISGGPGDDLIQGQQGHDTLDGGPGNDVIYGNNGSDTITGGPDNDTIRGGFGMDTIDGEGGNDILDGCGVTNPTWGYATYWYPTWYDSHADQITGGPGADEFRNYMHLQPAGGGFAMILDADDVVDYSPREGDSLTTAIWEEMDFHFGFQLRN